MSEALRRDPSADARRKVQTELPYVDGIRGEILRGGGKLTRPDKKTKPEPGSIEEGIQKALKMAENEQALKNTREEITGITELSPWDIKPANQSDITNLEQEEFDTAMLLDQRHAKPPMFNVPGKGRVTLPKGK